MDPRELLIANLEVVERVIAYTCRRHRLEPQDAEDFASTVKLRLIENDYAILQRFQRRSSFATFITVVIQRMLLDYRVHEWGKWHPSAEAKRLGATATELEKLLVRDGQTIEQALPALQALDRTVSIDGLRHLASQLPARLPKRRMVDLEEAATVSAKAVDHGRPHREQASVLASDVIRTFIDALASDERLILQLRFDSEMTVAQIARALHLDQKQLYRRIDRLLRDIRVELERNGVDAGEAAELIHDRGVVLDFNLGNSPRRPSMEQEKIAPGKEEASS